MDITWTPHEHNVQMTHISNAKASVFKFHVPSNFVKIKS